MQRQNWHGHELAALQTARPRQIIISVSLHVGFSVSCPDKLLPSFSSAGFGGKRPPVVDRRLQCQGLLKGRPLGDVGRKLKRSRQRTRFLRHCLNFRELAGRGGCPIILKPSSADQVEIRYEPPDQFVIGLADTNMCCRTHGNKGDTRSRGKQPDTAMPP
jgi:hypothetical protein